MEVLEDAAALAQIEPAWRELACPAGPSTPFMQPEWIRAWWRAFGQADRLRVVAIWQGDRLAGVLPLMLSQERRYGISVRRLGALANDHSPRVDVLLASGAEGVVEAIWRYIASIEAQWDIFELPRLVTNSPTLQQFSERAHSGGFRFGTWQAEASPYIAIGADWNDYLAGRSRNFRKEVRRKRRHLSQSGQSSLEIFADPSAVTAALDDALKIEADGWKGRAGSAMQSTPEVQRFYREQAVEMAAMGKLRLHFLKFGGERIAFDLSLKFDHRLYSLKSGFRNAQAADSPGLVLLSLMLEHYMSSDLEEIDLLGEEDDFKGRWTDTTRSHHWFISFARNYRGRAVHRIKFGMVPGIKRLRSRLAGNRGAATAARC